MQIECNSTCSTCFGELSSNCLSCKDVNKVLYNNTCSDSCPPHTYNKQSICYTCPLTCYTCFNESHGCTVCAQNYNLWLGQCIGQCPDGTYANESGICETCEYPCLTCKSSTLCTSCLTSLFLTQFSCVLAEQCPAGTYGDTVLGLCNKCDISCSTCSGPTNSDCTSCDASVQLVKATSFGPSACKLMVCKDGQYYFYNKTSRQPLCLDCNPECDTCNKSFPDSCTKCTKAFIEFPSTVNGLVLCKTCGDLRGFKNSKTTACEGRK